MDVEQTSTLSSNNRHVFKSSVDESVLVDCNGYSEDESNCEESAENIQVSLLEKETVKSQTSSSFNIDIEDHSSEDNALLDRLQENCHDSIDLCNSTKNNNSKYLSNDNNTQHEDEDDISCLSATSNVSSLHNNDCMHEQISQTDINFNNLILKVLDISNSISKNCILFSHPNKNRSNGIVSNTITEDKNVVKCESLFNELFIKLNELKECYEMLKVQPEGLFKNHNVSNECCKCKTQLTCLEDLVNSQNSEINELRDKLSYNENQFFTELNEARSLYESEIVSLQKKYEAACNDKEAAVMRYVNNEKELISLRKEKENFKKQLKEIEKERDAEIKKFNVLAADKSSVSNMLNTKKCQLASALSLIENLKEELRCKDIKASWVENNFQNEISHLKNDKDILKNQLKVLESEIETLKKQLYSKENTDLEISNECEQINNESLVETNKPGNKEICSLASRGSPELENLHRKHTTLINENNSLSLKIQKLETERFSYEQNVSNLKEISYEQNQKITELQNKLSEIESLRSCLKQEQERLSSCQIEIERLRETNNDLRQDIECCREREADLLAFTEKLTSKNVTLQSEYTSLEAKRIQLENENAPLEKRIFMLEDKITVLVKQLNEEQESRYSDNRILTQNLADKKKQIDALNTQLEEQQAKNQSLKCKYSSSIRELTRELQQLKKTNSNEPSECNSGSGSIILESRTNSCSSLNEQGKHVTLLEPDKQSLIEKIVELQRANAKYAEKIEFLEEHISQMLSELKKKTKVLQNYILREQTGTLSSKVMDDNKAEMSKYGGIMSMLYNSNTNAKSPDDCPISLELSLEINRKLQAVLEDTLLKNITLKENIETLGKEIERLSKN